MSWQLKTASSAATNQERSEVSRVVAEVIDEVRVRGDEAVRRYSEKFDHWSPETFRLTADQVEEIVGRVPREALDDLRAAQANVRRFAEHQLESMREFEVETEP